MQRLVVSEALELVKGSRQPRRYGIILYDDLANSDNEVFTNPGTRLRIIGVLQKVPKALRTGGESVISNYIIEANNFEVIEGDYLEIEYSKEEILQFKELSQNNNLLDAFAYNLFQDIEGNNEIKKALILQQVGGSRFKTLDGKETRREIHILLCGDPSTAKSDMVKRVQKIAPKCRFSSGSGSSKAGLTGCAMFDDFLNVWVVEGGLLTQANEGIVITDEFDKMNDKDRYGLHETMENGTTSISKGNVSCTLLTRTSILASANPKHSRFNPNNSLADQLDIPPTIFTRFDLIFPTLDKPNRDKDTIISSKIGDRYLSISLNIPLNSKLNDKLSDLTFVRKYIAYIRNNYQPHLTKISLDYLSKFYVDRRHFYSSKVGISFSPRQFEALIRLACSHAKLRMSNKVSIDDCKVAITLLDYCLNKLCLTKYDEGIQVDIDFIEGGGVDKDNKKKVVLRVLNDLTKNFSDGLIPLEDLLIECTVKGLVSEDVQKIVQDLLKNGDVFEPQKGIIQCIIKEKT